MPKKLTGHIEKNGKKNKQIQWEDAMEAVIRDITNGPTSKHPSPPVVQIVIYESSV